MGTKAASRWQAVALCVCAVLLSIAAADGQQTTPVQECQAFANLRTVDGLLRVRSAGLSLDETDATHYAILTNDTIVYIEFSPAAPESVLPGSLVKVYIDTSLKSQLEPGLSVVVCIEVLEGSTGTKDYSLVNGQPFQFTSITYLLNICGKTPAVTADDIKRVYFSGSGISSLSGWFSSCSHDRVLFSSGNNLIVPNVPVPCKSTCSNPDLDTWAFAADNYASKTLGINVAKYKHRIVIIPQSITSCPFAGTADMGCFGRCSTFVMNDLSRLVYGFAHELGHNMGLRHASTPGREYGDTSSAMGGCCDNRCYNGPNMWQLQWADQPVAQLTGTNFPAGTWKTFTLPSIVDSPKSMIQVAPSTWSSSRPMYWLSYRSGLGEDSVLKSPYNGAISIHIFNGSISSQSAFMTEAQGAISVGQTWSQTWGGQFRVKMLSKSADGKSATLSICRFTQTTESGTTCKDGLDNDCDGLIDGQDSGCGGSTGTLPRCNRNGQCEPGENSSTCPDCPSICGDGWCDKIKETASNCREDCPPVCGDKICDSARGETSRTCFADCPVCGDKICSPLETSRTCVSDCCPASTYRCGDGKCDAHMGETCKNCPADCASQASRVYSGQSAFCCGQGGATSGCRDNRCTRNGFRCSRQCSVVVSGK